MAHCFEGVTKKILKKASIRDSAKQYLIANGLKQFLSVYGTHYISGYINAASFFAQLNLFYDSQTNINQVGSSLKFEIGKFVGKKAEAEDVESQMSQFEQMNMSSFMDVRGIPVTQGAISITDIIMGYK